MHFSEYDIECLNKTKAFIDVADILPSPCWHIISVLCEIILAFKELNERADEK